MAVTLNTALIPGLSAGSSRTLASRLTPLGILFQPTCRIKQRGAQARVPYSPSALLPCSVAPQQGQALTSPSKGANPTGSRCAGDVPGDVERPNFDLPIDLSPRPRDGIVVPSLHCMNDPQPEGQHGKLHWATSTSTTVAT